MGKYKNAEGKYCQVYWQGIKILNEHNEKIPYSAKWLYTHLCWLEHRYTGKKSEKHITAFRILDV